MSSELKEQKAESKSKTGQEALKTSADSKDGKVDDQIDEESHRQSKNLRSPCSKQTMTSETIVSARRDGKE